jgi:hypothetical protein
MSTSQKLGGPSHHALHQRPMNGAIFIDYERPDDRNSMKISLRRSDGPMGW